VIALLLHCLIWRRPGWATPPPRRRLALATPPPRRRLALATPPPRRRLALATHCPALATLPLGVSTPGRHLELTLTF